jgi:hypothetical protein
LFLTVLDTEVQDQRPGGFKRIRRFWSLFQYLVAVSSGGYERKLCPHVAEEKE